MNRRTFLKGSLAAGASIFLGKIPFIPERDDAAYLQAIINKYPRNGARIVLPYGHYILKRPLDLRGFTNTLLDGNGSYLEHHKDNQTTLIEFSCVSL